MPGSGDSIRQRIPGLALGAVAIGVCLGLRATGTLEGLELAVYDRFVRGQDRADPGPAAVIGISIGEAEFSRYGFPIPDAVLARGLERLVDAGVTAIGVDLYRPGPASDSAGAPSHSVHTELTNVSRRSRST